MQFHGRMNTNLGKLLKENGYNDTCFIDSLVFITRKDEFINLYVNKGNAKYDIQEEHVEFKLNELRYYLDELGYDTEQELIGELLDAEFIGFQIILYEKKLPKQIKDQLYFEITCGEIHTTGKIIEYNVSEAEITSLE